MKAAKVENTWGQVRLSKSFLGDLLISYVQTGHCWINKIMNKSFGHCDPALTGCSLVRSAALAALVLALVRHTWHQAKVVLKR